jgi:hypothetical protein
MDFLSPDEQLVFNSLLLIIEQRTTEYPTTLP